MMTQPGARILAITRRVVDRGTLNRLIEPAVADLQHDYQVASGSWPRRKALARGYLSLIRLSPAVALRCVGRTASGFTRDDDGLLGRLLVVTLPAVACITASLTLPVDRGGITNTPLLLALVIPQALALALPLGLLVGALIALRGRPVRNRVAKVRLAIVALVVALCTLVTTAWLVPGANQRFREVVASALALRDGRAVPVEIAPGPNELTFTELSHRIKLWRASPENSGQVNYLRFIYHVRLALAAAPFALLILAMGVNVVSRGSWWAIVLTIVANPLSAMVIWGGAPYKSAPMLVAWLPVIGMAATGWLMLVAAQPRQRAPVPRPT